MNKEFIMDIHNHSNWSDGDASIEEMVINAIKYNIDVLGISDHFNNKDACSIANSELEAYILEINMLKNKYLSKIEILSGLEIPFSNIISEKNTLSRLINNLDYVLFEYIENLPSNININELSNNLKWIECKKGLAHTNIEAVAIKYNRIGGINYFIKFMKDNDLFLEINSNSSYSFFDNIIYYPDNSWAKALFQSLNSNGIKVSIGSDSHSSEDFEFGRLIQANKIATENLNIINF